MKCYRVKLQINHPVKYLVLYGLAVSRDDAILQAYVRARDYGVAVEGYINVREIGDIEFSPRFNRALCWKKPILEKIESL
jgi:hypothetical protein